MADSKLTRWLTSPLALLRQILTLDDSPHSIALGVAIGMFIGLTPTVGFQMILVLVLAAVCRPLFRFNTLAALITVYVSNPVTTVPIYYFNYRVGALFIEGDVTRQHFARLLEYDSLGEWWQTIVSLFVLVGWPLILGSLIVATIGGVATYPVLRWLLAWKSRHPLGLQLLVQRRSDAPPKPSDGSRSPAASGAADHHNGAA